MPPFSLILSTANLQDKYDVLCFYRDNLISESGTVGDWIDVAHLPKFLGSDMATRLMKWKAYKKQGIALYDSSQEGQQLNTSFQGFDDTVPVQAIQAIDEQYHSPRLSNMLLQERKFKCFRSLHWNVCVVK